MTHFKVHPLQRIKRNGEIDIGRIEIDHVIDAGFGNESQNFFRRFAVRINKAHAASGGDVGDNHIFQERAFPGPRFTDDVYVTAAIVWFDPKRTFRIAKIGFADKKSVGHSVSYSIEENGAE